MPSYQTYSKGPKAGQPKTLTDRVIRFLTEGLKQHEMLNGSKKYRTFSGMNSQLWFVGNAGDIRVSKNITNSFSITDKVHKMMKLWEEKNGK